MAKRAVTAAVALAVLAAALWLGPCAGPPGEPAAPGSSASHAPVGAAGEAPHPRARPTTEPEAAAAADEAGARTVEVVVRVVDAADAPVEDALVEVFRAQRGAEQHNADLRRGTLLMFDEPTAERAARTGEDGVVTFRLAATHGWSFAASKDGYARDTTNTPGFGPGLDFSHSGARATVVLHLRHECRLTGRVRDEDGAPVVGAVVALTPGFMFEFSGVRVVRAATDAEGRYALRALQPGTARVHVAREGQAVLHTEVGLPYQGDFDLVLRTPGHLVGRVLDAADGAPIADAVVRASTFGFGGIVETTSAADGSYRLPWAMDQPVGHLIAERDGFTLAAGDTPTPAGAVRNRLVQHPSGDERLVLSIEVPARTEVRQDVLLVRAARIHGLVRGDGRPLAGVRVQAAAGREPDGVWVLPAVSDAEGRYELTSVPAGVVVLHAALEGWYAAGLPDWQQALRPGAPASPWRIEVAAGGGDVAHDIEMTRGIAVEGVVVMEDGTPVAGAEVRSLQSGMGWMRAQTRTAADGTFRLEGVAPDRVAFVAAIAPSACMEDDALDIDPATCGRLILPMIPPVRVTGTVTDADGSPAPAGTVVAGTVEVTRTPRGGFGVPDFSPSSRAGTDGRYALEIRAPRTARIGVLATAPGRSPAAGVGFRADEARGGRVVDIRLPPEETVRGRVVVRGSGAPVAGANVRTGWAAGPAVVRTGADGTFVLNPAGRMLPSGEGCKVFVTAEGFALGRAVAPRGGGDVLVEMDPVLEISGTVRLAGGGPAAGVTVSAERQFAIDRSWYEFGEPGIGPFSAEAVTDAQGAFRLRGLPAGRYAVLARPPADGSVRVRPARTAAMDAGARDVVVIVEARAADDVASKYDSMSDGDVGREAIWRLMQKEPETSAAAWEALLARPLTDDARAEALSTYANGTLRTLGRRDDAVRALEEAGRLAAAGTPRRASVLLNLATVLVEMGRFADAIAPARDAAAASAGKDPLVNAFARLRGAQASAGLGEADAAREEFVRLRDEAGDRRDGGWPSVRALAEAGLRP